MRGTVNPNNLLFDPEIEKTTRERRKQIRRKAQEAMGDQHNHLNNLPPPNRDVEDPPPQPRTMRDFVMPPVSGCGIRIRKPTINANNFKIKASLIQLVQQNQFRGERNENPCTHISAFTHVASTIKINGASEEAIKLMVFPFSLADRTLSWYQALKPDSMTDWNTLVQKFINKYHPPTLRNKLRGIGEIKLTMMTLQLADHSITYPYGLVENVLVKVVKFIFPVDFVVLDIEEDTEIPLILGRPFLATGRAIIDMATGELKLRVNDEHVTFNIFDSMKHIPDNDSCFRIDIINACVNDVVEENIVKLPLEKVLTCSDELSASDELGIVECKVMLDALPVHVLYDDKDEPATTAPQTAT
ncbi:hypothetical protein L6164_023996 [Bauhinia variegata]|uniref:Uncharacterized protein n=1 Tax=Bauhinia variegata TaxID=167791 RepID=A0ACB9LX30_BAUVA|nr:hypothetical protein L6164_023996 [Bauhinia variegata]